MSAETSKWLNTRTLIGFTDKRGTAWHYRAEDQGDESNHYPDAIPYEDVERRLFNWTAEESPVYIRTGPSFQKVDGRKAIVTSDTNECLGIFSDGYQPHQYNEWLLNNVATIIDADLGIGSAGLLRNRAQAWVSVEVPENIETPEGFTFRPHLVACTSFDGSLATTYKRTITAVVCDNTLASAMRERGSETYRVKHSKYSGMRLTDARAALGIVYQMAEDFSAEVARLASWNVSDEVFFKHLNIMVPVPEEDGRAKTVASKKQDEIVHLYRADERSSQWNGTALGVLQAHNTWSQHYAQVRKGIPRAMRNMENLLTGKTETADNRVLATLAAI